MRSFIARANPLRLGGAAVPPELVLIARALAVALILMHDWPVSRYLPYLELLDRVGSDQAFSAVLRAAVAAGFLLLLFSRSVRLGCFLAGAAYLIGLIADRPRHSVAHTFVACVFLIISMSSHASGARLFRAQVLLVYLGAIVNKALDADWWNGRYFETFMIHRHANALYTWAASSLPPMALSRVFGIATMAVQAAIVACLISRRFRVHGAVLGIFFHGTMTVMTGQTFGPFLYAILLSYLAFFPWPGRIRFSGGSNWTHRWLERFLTWTDFDRRLELAGTAPAPKGMRVEMPGHRYDGGSALRALALGHPLFYFACVLGLVYFGTAARVGTLALLMLGAACVSVDLIRARRWEPGG
jgi:hypothetical protein